MIIPPKQNGWERLRAAYYKAKEIFPYCEVGVRSKGNDYRYAVVYIKGKKVELNGDDVYSFAKMISEAQEMKISGEMQIDLVFASEW